MIQIGDHRDQRALSQKTCQEEILGGFLDAKEVPLATRANIENPRVTGEGCSLAQTFLLPFPANSEKYWEFRFDLGPFPPADALVSSFSAL